MSKQTFWSLLMGIFVITIVFMLVRPGAPASDAVKDVSNALSALIKAAVNGLPDNGGSNG